MKENLKWIFNVTKESYGIILTIFAFFVLGKFNPSIIVDTNLKAILFFLAWILIAIIVDIFLRTLTVIAFEIKDLLTKKRG